MSQVERVERAASRKYLRKAEELLRSGDDAASRKDWNATAVSAIHAGISAADAYLSWVHGQRSTSKDHLDVVRLLTRLGGDRVGSQANSLQRLLANKNKVEYEDRLMTMREARDALIRAQRLVAWAREALRES